MLRGMNTTHRLLTLALTLAATSLLGGAATVHAQTVITSLPYTITATGAYVLNGNLSSSQTSGNLITVNASNVTIDFQGHFISGAVGNTSQTTTGIYASERSNLTIKNGTIAHCKYGVDIEGNDTATTNSVNHQIDNLRVTYCSYVGIFIAYGPGSRISNCQVSQTGYSGTSSAYGIIVYGASTVVQNNVVSNVTVSSGGFACGIYGNGFSRQNVVSGASYGVSGGKYQDNLTDGCTTPFNGGTDAGGNN